tara:strand:- start:153 stop:620 length:468 start_codon:yes stop_codon:yes gene_type:complete
MAGSLNKVIIIGNLGADPEIKEMPDGTKMAKFSVATTERYTNKLGEKVSNTEWHNVVLWRRQAEVAEQYLHKGDSVCIEGKLKTRSWEDENGTKKYATDIQADNMTMLGRRKDTDGAPHQSNTANLNQDTATIITNHNPDNSNQSVENDSKDLPF